jgi:hypothetical protein
MKTSLRYYIAVIIILFAICGFTYQSGTVNSQVAGFFPTQQLLFDPNNISTYIYDSGIFNQDLRVSNHPGFQWPKGSGKYAIFTSGFSIGAYMDNLLREAMASYWGEWAPGYITDSSGIPVARTDFRFKLYKVKHGDNAINNPDWLNWGLMVPYGAPYIDVDHNGIYNPVVDTPGVKNATQTIFGCLTDGFLWSHSSGEGFGGGTLPLYAEIHLTAWGYNTGQLQDVQFLKWEVINKSKKQWNRTYFLVYSDNDLGYANDDYNGCDTIRHLGYTYNGDNYDDEAQPYSYGFNPPAVGIVLLESPINRSINPPKPLGMTSLIFVKNPSTPGPPCESDPNGETVGAYNFMRGLKKDLTPWVIPYTNPPRTTKYCYSGDPENLTGWTEYGGSVQNCGGVLTGNTIPVNPVGQRRILLSSGAENFTISPGERQVFVIAQLIARGTNNLNSVTKLKQLTDYVRNFYNSVIGVKEIKKVVPSSYILYQNYPNPFNPTTTIKFDIPSGVKSEKSKVKVVVYDVLGKQIAELLNENLSPGTYEVIWDASNYPSGVYFYKLSAKGFINTKKMVALK